MFANKFQENLIDSAINIDACNNFARVATDKDKISGSCSFEIETIETAKVEMKRTKVMDCDTLTMNH